VVTLAGVDEVAVGDEGDYTLKRMAVGKRPTAVLVLADGRTAAVANTHSDSISLIDLDQRRVRAEYALGPMAELSIAQRGEVLFHSARMSMDGWMSCQSCHTDGHSNGLLNDNFSDGSFGTPKRILSLHGTGMSPPWAWNGEKHDLDGQILQTIRTTMLGPDPASGQVESLAMYLRTLEAPPALDKLRGRQDAAAIARGAEVFRRQDCGSCHAPHNAFTSGDAYDVGLTDEAGVRRYNPPALEGLSHRSSYLHDGRAKTVEEIFTRHRHPAADARVGPAELADLVAYLRSL
jgi:cytochrome c peroxidase